MEEWDDPFEFDDPEDDFFGEKQLSTGLLVDSDGYFYKRTTRNREFRVEVDECPSCCGIGIIGELDQVSTDIRVKSLLEACPFLAKENEYGYLLINTLDTPRYAKLNEAIAAGGWSLNARFKNPKTNNTILSWGKEF